MAKSRQSKTDTLASLSDKLSRMKAVAFTHYQGLSVKDVTDLRKQLRADNVDFLVTKKTLLRKALGDAGLDGGLVDHLPGDVAMAFGYDDEILPAKLLQKYRKDHPSVELLAGLVKGEVLNAHQIVALAKLPGREELIAQTIWTIKAPLTGMVTVLAGNLRGLIQVVKALSERQPVTA